MRTSDDADSSYDTAHLDEEGHLLNPLTRYRDGLLGAPSL